MKYEIQYIFRQASTILCQILPMRCINYLANWQHAGHFSPHSALPVSNPLTTETAAVVSATLLVALLKVVSLFKVPYSSPQAITHL